MASPDRSPLVVPLGRFAMAGEPLHHIFETPCLQRILLPVHPGLLRGEFRHYRLGGFAQIFADMIEIDQVGALHAESLFRLAHDPRCSVSDRVDMGIRAEAGADRAYENLPT